MKNTLKYKIILLVIATGIASVVTQLLFIRELLAQFQGNELIIALVLFNWLILGGLGTRLAVGAKAAVAPRLVRLSFFLAALGPIQMAAIRWLRPLIFGPGVSVGFYPIFLFSLLTMAPYALLVGYLLPYSLYVMRSGISDYPGTRIYLADNLGDVCGGAIFTFALVFWATPLQALLLAHLPLIAVAAWMAGRRAGRIVGPLLTIAVAVAAVMVEQPLMAPWVGRLEHYEESRFARLAVHRHQEQVTLFADGRPIAGTEDTVLAELSVHYPLSQVDRPHRVLLLSASGGMIRELQKYSPSAIDYVELDPAVVRLMIRYGLIADVPELNPIAADGRAWLQNCPEKYDAVLLNLPEPDTFQLNRFFTDHFFGLVRRQLKDTGIFSFHVEGAANFLTVAQTQKVSSLYATARRHFPYVLMLPGERIFFLCSPSPIDPDIPARLAARGIQTRFVAPYFYGDVTAERIQALKQSIDTQVRINRDTHPFLMQLMLAQWFVKFGDSPRWFMIATALLLVGYLMHMRREEYVLFSTGLLAMGCEVMLIFAFQIFLGYVYAKIGMIVTVFLAGLMPGAWLGSRPRQAQAFLFLSDLAIIALILVIVVSLHWWGDRLPSFFYYASGFWIAMACGFQIPLALAGLGDDNPAAARIFSVDLVGAAFGALMVSTIFIPHLGLGGTAALLIAVKISSLMLMGERYASYRSARLSNR